MKNDTQISKMKMMKRKKRMRKKKKKRVEKKKKKEKGGEKRRRKKEEEGEVFLSTISVGDELKEEFRSFHMNVVFQRTALNDHSVMRSNVSHLPIISRQQSMYHIPNMDISSK